MASAGEAAEDERSPDLVAATDIDRWLTAGATIIDAPLEAEYAEDFLPAPSTIRCSTTRSARVGTVDKLSHRSLPKRVGRRWWCATADMIEKHFAGSTEGLGAAGLLLARRQALRHADLAVARDRFDAKASRRLQGVPARVNAELPQLAQRFRYVTICGCTGPRQDRAADCGDAGAQVIDLEGWPIIAARCWARVTRHSRRKKRFDALLWNALRTLDPARPVFVESESRRSVWCKCPTRCASR